MDANRTWPTSHTTIPAPPVVAFTAISDGRWWRPDGNVNTFGSTPTTITFNLEQPPDDDPGVLVKA